MHETNRLDDDGEMDGHAVAAAAEQLNYDIKQRQSQNRRKRGTTKNRAGQ